jgi:hypothetical protein
MPGRALRRQRPLFSGQRSVRAAEHRSPTSRAFPAGWKIGAPAQERRRSVGFNQAKSARRETGAMPNADRPARRPDEAGGTPAPPETPSAAVPPRVNWFVWFVVVALVCPPNTPNRRKEPAHREVRPTVAAHVTAETRIVRRGGRTWQAGRPRSQTWKWRTSGPVATTPAAR